MGKQKPHTRPKQHGNAEACKPYRWKPGQSGNPSGRPIRKPLTDALILFLSRPKEANIIAKAIIKQARKGRYQEFKEIADRVEGKVSSRLEVTGAGGEEIKATVEAKLSVGDLLGAIRTIYGLNSPEAAPAKPAVDVPLPNQVDQRPITKKDRGQK